jgi:hypothetical protein
MEPGVTETRACCDTHLSIDCDISRLVSRTIPFAQSTFMSEDGLLDHSLVNILRLDSGIDYRKEDTV